MNGEKRSTYIADDEIEIDLREILKVLRKWKKLIIGMTLLGVVMAAIISFFVLTPIYEAQTLLLVTQAADKAQGSQQQQGLEGVVNTVSRLPVMTMNTYLGQLKSEVLMQRVIKNLGLEDSLAPGDLSGMITATVVKDSNLIEIKIQNQDPVLAARIGNQLNKELLQLISEKNQEQMSRSVSFLQQQRESTDNELDAAEEALKGFQELPRGVAVLEQEFAKKSEGLATLETRLNMASIEIRQLKAGVARLEQELSIIPKTISVDRLDPVTNRIVTTQEVNSLYISTAQQLNDKKAALAEKEAEIEGLEVIIGTNRHELDALQAEVSGKRLQQERLQSEVDRLRMTSSTLAQKTTETQITKSIDLGDTSVIVVSEASMPTSPIKPNKKLNMAIALVLGLMFFTLLAFVLERLDNTIKNPEDVSTHLGLPVLGMIPVIDHQTSKGTSYGG